MAISLSRSTATRSTRWTPQQWAALACVLAGYVVGTLTGSGTAIALPVIASELGASAAAMQWFVTGYMLATTCLVLVAGALGDRFGRRLVLRISASVYTLGILGVGLASSVLVLNSSRIVAGVGSAGLMACGAAVLSSTFDGADRIRAFALCGTAGGLGMAFGPSAAGWIVSGVGWRGLFGVLAGVSVVMVATTFLIPESRAEVPRRLDLAGAGLLVVGLSLLLLGISTTTSAGLGFAGAGLLVAACLVLAAFVVRSLRVPYPLLDLRLLRDRTTTAWLLAGVVATAGLVGVTVYLPTYLLVVHGVGAGPAGTWLLAFTVPVFLTPMLVSRWVTRGGSAARTVALAIGLQVLGLLALALLARRPEAWAVMVPTALLGIGVGAMSGLCDAQLMSRVGNEHVGMMSGLLNTVRSGTSSILLALFGAGLVVAIGQVAGPVAAERLATGDSGGVAAAAEAFGSGWAAVATGNAVVIAAVGLVFVLLLRGRRRAR